MAAAFISLHFTLYLCLPTKILTSSQEENQFIYNGFQEANLQLDGNAEVHSNGLLQLTNTTPQVSGHAFHRYPITFNNSSLSFSTNFIFAIETQQQKPSGHGLAFAISPSMDFSEAFSYQYLGLFNTSSNGLSTNHVFAVELDTIQSPDLNDINDNHVGVDMNSLISLDSAPVTYFSDKERNNKTLELISGSPIQLWINYDQDEMLLNVSVAPVRTPKPSKPLLSTSINLSSIFLDSMYVGFSASTGSVTSNHYILGWSFNRSGQAQNLEISKLPWLPKQNKSTEKLKITIIVLLVTVTIVLISFFGGYIMRRKKFAEIREDWERQYGPQRFSYKDLYKATKGFKETELVGKGGFGRVYRGILGSPIAEVAVKRVSHDSNQGMKEFVAEIACMGRLRHRNLVHLHGYCRRKGELLLVYDYMPNGSLDKFLFDKEKSPLNWCHRYRIIKGVASSLLYLHEEWEQVVLHRDVKAGNVLLDSNLNGRLGDFGLARLYDHGSQPRTTGVVGTMGYLAPELTRTGKATTNTDVFAFGAFMLETVCGRKPIERQGLGEQMALLEFILDCWKRGDILKAIDPRLEGNYIIDEVKLVLNLGLLCSYNLPTARPTMRQVMQCFNGDVVFQELTLESVALGVLGEVTEASSDITSFPLSYELTSAQSFSAVDSIICIGR